MDRTVGTLLVIWICMVIALLGGLAIAGSIEKKKRLAILMVIAVLAIISVLAFCAITSKIGARMDLPATGRYEILPPTFGYFILNSYQAEETRFYNLSRFRDDIDYVMVEPGDIRAFTMIVAKRSKKASWAGTKVTVYLPKNQNTN